MLVTLNVSFVKVFIVESFNFLVVLVRFRPNVLFFLCFVYKLQAGKLIRVCCYFMPTCTVMMTPNDTFGSHSYIIRFEKGKIIISLQNNSTRK